MASSRRNYEKLSSAENWLVDELIRASQHDLHVNLRDSKTRKDFLWLWCPVRLQAEPKTWNRKTHVIQSWWHYGLC